MAGSYKETLNLPKTDFPMKANLPRLEPTLIERWQKENIYARMVEKKSNATPYVFHDGPPYANAHLHLGTMLNKILKDFVVKFKNMSGSSCAFIPGWDCHGLPIELQVEKEMGTKRGEGSPLEVRAACRAYAAKFIDIQREEFKRLGVLARWEKPYITMSNDYEAAIAHELASLIGQGLVFKGSKPILWCTSCRTALAEAEVEYADHTSPSIYVKFRLSDDGDLRKKMGITQEPIFLVIWTTTPWTIPSNLGIALHADFTYASLKVDNEVWVIAEDLVERVKTETGNESAKVLSTFEAEILEGKRCRHPLIDRDSLVMMGTHVTLESGTGLVHIAPGHGQEDFELGSQHGLPALSPIDNGGKFVESCGIPEIVGLHVEKANPVVIEKLKQAQALVAQATLSHSYPHCWRCKRPVVFRVTEQWFISMEKKNLRKEAKRALEKVEWIPPWGAKRIGGMVETRPDWCISRQRLWGVPIVAMVCGKCKTSHATHDLVEHAAKLFEKKGSDVWWQEPVATFLPKDFLCPKCGESKQFEKEKDILDVWFDSGVSYAAVLERQEGIKEPADLYLEGSDQHRGWFQTSLLTSIGTRNRAPYKRVLTHGFVVDGKGRKYSKSEKNYIPPEKIIEQYGAEVIRLWVASEDYRDDIRCSAEIIDRLSESYRKIRNTFRYLLGNLSDFHPDRDHVSYGSLLEIDRWGLHILSEFIHRTRQAYDAFEFHTIFHAINRLCTVELSAVYFDILKDRLYAEKRDGLLRRSAQTVLWQVGDALLRVAAPILSFTSDEVWGYFPKQKTAADSIFLADFPDVQKNWSNPDLQKRWDELMTFRSVVTKGLEEARVKGLLGNALQGAVTIEAPEKIQKFLESFGKDLADIFIVSHVTFGKASGDHVFASNEVKGFSVGITRAPGEKCERCWKYATSVGKNAKYPDICARCAGVLDS